MEDLISKPRLSDYVLAHEVVHLVDDDHVPESWSVLGKIPKCTENPRP